jgi:8-oxo-dGTP diphosphatase
MDQMHYVLGFAFSEDLSRVALIRKNRPEWQAGKLNGIGGKVEPGETMLDAMIREFREETGFEIRKWQRLGTMTGDSWEVGVFVSYHNNLRKLQTMTDETVGTFRNDEIILERHETISNLPWLICYALDSDVKNGKVKNFSVEY